MPHPLAVSEARDGGPEQSDLVSGISVHGGGFGTR